MQISKHIHAIRSDFHIITPAGAVIDRFVYSYLIYGTHGICLIDTGVSSTSAEIFNYIRSTDRRVEDISLIVQTHTHPDHIGSTRTIKAETGCGVAVHPAEKDWIENVRLQAKERPVPGFDSLVSGSVAVNRLLEDGEVFDLGCGLKLRIFHTPGHSKGSISILLLGYMALFCGDAVPVPGDIPVYEDAAALASSIKKLRGIEGIRHFLPSWDEPAKGDEAYRRMDEGLRYLQRIHEIVLGITAGQAEPDPMGLCRAALKELGLPEEAANPLLAKTFMSHLQRRDKKVIID